MLWHADKSEYIHISLLIVILIYHYFKFTFDSGQDGCCSPSVAVI